MTSTEHVAARDATQIRAMLSRIPTTAALDLLKDKEPHRLVLNGVKPIFPLAGSIAGRARTLRFLPARADYEAAPSGPANFKLLDDVQEGEFLVFDACGWKRGAVLGDMLALRAKLNGAVGVATDGVMRDLSGLEEVQLPVFASGTFPVPIASTMLAWEADIPVQCGGALVTPNDWILADRDAVIVIPECWVQSVCEGFELLASEEHFCRTLLHSGLDLQEAYPMPKALRPLLAEYRATGTMPSEAAVRRAVRAETMPDSGLAG